MNDVKNEDLDIQAVNLTDFLARRQDGVVMPIMNLLDVLGDECTLDQVMSCVAGPSPEGKWYHIILGNFYDDIPMLYERKKR